MVRSVYHVQSEELISRLVFDGLHTVKCCVNRKVLAKLLHSISSPRSMATHNSHRGSCPDHVQNAVCGEKRKGGGAPTLTMTTEKAPCPSVVGNSTFS